MTAVGSRAPSRPQFAQPFAPWREPPGEFDLGSGHGAGVRQMNSARCHRHRRTLVGVS